MFRKVAGFGAAAGAAAAPNSSQCYSRPAARVPAQSSHTVDLKNGPQDDWQLVFGEPEVRDTIAQVVGYPPKAAQTETTLITEEDASPEGSDSDSASTYLMQADNRIVSQDKLQESFGNTLLTLLTDRGVQHACMRALGQDPAFSEMLTQLEGGAPLRNTQSMPSLLPPAPLSAEAQEPSAASSLEANVEESLKAFLDGIGDRVQALGSSIRGAWDNAGAAVGGTVLRIGYAIRSLLGKKFNAGSSAEFQWDGSSHETEERVGKVMMQVAMCVVALLIFKRVMWAK